MMQTIRDACHTLPPGDAEAAAAAAARQDTLTKPPGSLGRLESLVAWLARWQGRAMPKLDHVDILVFAGNHGVTARGVSPYPPEVTAQMVGNFQHGGAAINPRAAAAGATLRVIALDLDRPTADFTQAPAMTEAEFQAAFTAGQDAVRPGTDLLCLGEMGIGNTTAAAAMAAALFGGSDWAGDWAGRGTGVDDAGLARKIATIEAGLARHPSTDPLEIARCLGGRELAAILGAVFAARHLGVPVLLDGFVCTAAAAPLAKLAPDGLAHCMAAHVSAEAAHGKLLAALGLPPLLDLGMRLGEATGAAVALLLARAALACHTGMATFAEAAVTDRPG
jgi:nicotinate-nucleotide--dimethylbenzimidazole phosphoribosyltransferase